jgi:hypothetical protein
MTTLRATCLCGSVEVATEGPPILAAACHCDDCQEGGRRIEALPGAPPVLGPGGGTEYVLVRRDRARVTRGADALRDHALRPGSGTRRVVASCCNAPMWVDARLAPYVDLYRARIGPGAPSIEARVMTRFAPPGSLPEDEVPRHRRVSAGLVARVAAATLPMLLHPRRERLGRPR